MIVERRPWASGQQKHTPTAKPKPRRRRRKMSSWGKALTTFWAGSGLFALGFAYFYEAAGWAFAAAGAAALGAATVYFETRHPGAVPTPNVSRPNSAKPAKTKRSGRGGGKPGTSGVVCTQTGVPVEQCTAGHKHAMTAEGVRRFKQCKRIGDPYGKATGQVSTVKPPRSKRPGVPTTNNAKPIPVGEPMRRVL